MPKINLTDDEKQSLIEALNNNIEPSPDILPKLFPGTAEKIDYAQLDRAKVPTLEYAGKRSKAAILAEASAGIGAAPLQTVRCFGEAKEDEWKNLIVQGDNLQFLKTCYRNEDPMIKDKVKGKVKLIYIDPPFATKSDFGGKEGEKSYTDKVDSTKFIESLRVRLIYLREMLADDGSIYIHLDSKMSHYTKLVLDEIFTKNNFRNEIIWHYQTYQGQAKNYFPRKHDTILMYAKTNSPTFHLLKDNNPEGTIDFTRWNQYLNENNEITGKNYPKTDSRFKGYYQRFIKENHRNPGVNDVIFKIEGGTVDSVWDIKAIDPKDKSERVGYPTQKPEKLLANIILASSNKGDLVVDLFAGSGTTSSVAEKLGRRWIACDFGKHAIYTMQRRMLRIGESKALEDEKDKKGKVVVKKGDPYKKEAKPFCVVSTGAYDFTHIMDLRKHKETYTNFVLGLFQLFRDEEKAKKYKLANIFAEKDGSPVEVYPVWEDEFLKDIRIDEEYLQGIITQSGGRLRGEYYIITPETCTNIGDTTLKNPEGKDITFKMLTFPYKVLEDVSRKLTLQDQPSSQDQVNQLISSTAFYFNEDVNIEGERTNDGLKITKFDTKILDKDGNRFPGFSGMAMLLVDDQYKEGKPFDMDKTVFAKDIKEDGSASVPGLGKSVAIIAIDKHGNESKPVKIK